MVTHNAAEEAVAAADPTVRQGYQGFGSFHSEDVEVLIRQPDGQYAPPPLPFPAPARPIGLPSLQFGDACRDQFLLDLCSWNFINHGAFGAPLRAGWELAGLWRAHCERQPLRFLDRELLPHLVAVIRRLAGALRCAPTQLVLVPNATTALWAVIGGLPLQSGDVVYSLDVGYGSVKKMLAAACARSGATHVEAALALPLGGPEDVVRLVGETLPQGAVLAVFDAVTSNTALALPLRELTALCAARGVPVLVDAAHALGALDCRELSTLGAHWVAANCHKWLCAPRGCALLWARDAAAQAAVRPPVLSHGAGAGFLSQFAWDGNRDYSPYLALPAVLDWWDGVGWQRLRQRNAALLRDATALLAARWCSRLLAPLSMCCSSMALVALPQALQRAPSGGPPTSADAKHVQDALFGRHIEVPIKCVAGALYVRISVHAYNTLSQYEALADAVLQLCATDSVRGSAGAS